MLTPYSPKYFEHIEGGYYPFSYLRDKIIVGTVRRLIPRKGRILEIGCGTGRFLSQIEEDYETYGIDISEYAIKEAKKRTRFSRLFVKDVADFNFHFKFDGIVAVNIIEHLKDPLAVLSNIKENLQKKGFLFIHLPTASNLLSRFFLNLFYKDDTHLFIPTVSEIGSLLEGIGFSLIHERSGSFLFLPLSHRLILNSLPVYFGIYQKRE